MRYNKNFYYMNIEYTNKMVDGMVGDNYTILQELDKVLQVDDYPESMIEFGCDLGNRLEYLEVNKKLGIEFDMSADLYIPKYTKESVYCFESLNEFLEKNIPNVPFSYKFDYGLFVEFFNHCDMEDHKDLIVRMLDYCDILILVSKELSKDQMTEKVGESFDVFSLEIPNSEYNFIFVCNKEDEDE